MRPVGRYPARLDNRRARSVSVDSGDWFKEDYPEGVDELCLEVEGQVKSYHRLKQLYVLFAETIHRLCLIGSAYEGSVELED